MSKRCLRKSERAKQRGSFFAQLPFRPVALSVLLPLFMGCAENKSTSTTRPSDWSQQAENDPSNFDPKMDDDSISGGSIGHFDKRAFDKDVDDVLSP